MIRYFENLARALLGAPFKELSESEQRVIESIANKEPVAANVNEAFHEELGFGAHLADRVALIGGSWPFVISFMSIMVAWILVNSLILTQPGKAFDPYPYILLNLGLSTLAALQAPFILMSQNRQAAKDRLKSDASYENSLKLDLEIMRLHQKVDEMREQMGMNHEE